MENNFSIIISTCDKFSDLWDHPIWRMNMIQSNNRPFKNKPLSNIQQAQFSIGWRFCPVCGNKLYKKIDGCSGTLQVKCSKCKETLRLDLAFRRR